MKLSTSDIIARKSKNKLTMLTCYDYPTALCLDNLNLDMLLVGDSLGEVVYGFENTTFVTNQIMVQHTAAVKRGSKNIHIVADMPFNTYNDPDIAVANASQLISAGADSVKLENPLSNVVEALCNKDIAVMGHVGLTPQTIHDYKKQGKDEESAGRIIADARRLEEAGCYSIVLEAIPDDLATSITKQLTIPTIGIASGTDTDGQVLVISDLIGMYKENRSYVKKEADVYGVITQAVNTYISKVQS